MKKSPWSEKLPRLLTPLDVEKIVHAHFHPGMSTLNGFYRSLLFVLGLLEDSNFFSQISNNKAN
jgi:hypothetical protein